MLLQPAANESALFKNVVKKLSTLTCDNATAKILSPLLWEIREFANVWPGCLRPPTHEHRTARERCVHYGPPNLVSQWLLGFPVHIQVMKSNHCCGFLMPIVYDDGLDGHVWPHVGAHDGALPSPADVGSPSDLPVEFCWPVLPVPRGPPDGVLRSAP